MMHERNYTLLFNLNGYESTATESLFSLSIGEQCGQEMARKNLLDIVTMEMKNKEARNASETHIYQERRRKEKCESMPARDLYFF
jgi:hypothetical protein